MKEEINSFIGKIDMWLTEFGSIVENYFKWLWYQNILIKSFFYMLHIIIIVLPVLAALFSIFAWLIKLAFAGSIFSGFILTCLSVYLFVLLIMVLD